MKRLHSKRQRIPHGHRKNVYERVVQDKKKVANKKAARGSVNDKPTNSLAR